MKSWLKSQKGSMAVYAAITILCFIIILMGVFLSTASVRKNQLKTLPKIKEAYEKDKENIQEIYEQRKSKETPSVDYIKNGLIAHYAGINNTENAHSNTTTTWKDLSGNNNDGTLSRALEEGKFFWEDNHITLAGVSENLGTYVDTPVNLNGKERTIIYTVDASNLTGSIWGDTTSENIKGLFNYQTFIANRGTTKELNDKIDYSFNKIGIYHYTISLSTKEFKFYVNGQLNQTLANTIGLETSNNIRFLAAYQASQNATNIKMYNFMIYDRVLTDSEILYNYNINKAKYES